MRFYSLLSAIACVASAICPDPELKAQSPIDIPRSDPIPNANNVTIAFSNPANAVVKNDAGETVKVYWDGGKDSKLQLNNVQYNSVQYHFHHPSEHTLRGYTYPFEMHMVHQTADKKIAVIGVFFEIGGEDNPFLNQVWSSIGLLGDPGTNVTVSGVNGAALKFNSDTGFYRYPGSLTTPPYTEGVEWTVVRDIQKMSKAQFEIYKKAMPEENVREVQPLNGRKVTLFAPSK
ncbi:carbonic anhydrase [Thraustotheca clavata]|uniref:Carbonic anhydrase n=1 Tax=Thraustotheca clavata TaxID=74557 RepID=A0A1V9Y7L1_9STRA|nr:carbonic anhydrase [Thraustotheca clavata]